MSKSPLSTWQRLYSSSKHKLDDVEKKEIFDSRHHHHHMDEKKMTVQLNVPPIDDLDDCNKIDEFKIKEWFETIQAKADAKETDKNTSHDILIEKKDTTNHSTPSTYESSFHDVNHILHQFSKKLHISSINPMQDELQSPKKKRV